MTVAELIDLLKHVDPDRVVYLECDGGTSLLIKTSEYPSHPAEIFLSDER